MISLFLLLFLKHFICDFLYQPPYQWMNKGTFGHPGGLIHSGQHILGTALILWGLGVSVTLISHVAIFEFVIHYLTDYAKMNLNAKMGWRCSDSNAFWISLGADQLIHYSTYAAIAAFVAEFI
jgi:hypothetical protein